MHSNPERFIDGLTVAASEPGYSVSAQDGFGAFSQTGVVWRNNFRDSLSGSFVVSANLGTEGQPCINLIRQ